MSNCPLICYTDPTLQTSAFVPNFTPSATSCNLPVISETRARLVNGVLFRSVDFGFKANSITVACTWYDVSNIETTDPTVVAKIKIFISDGTTTEEHGPYSQSEVTNPTPPPAYNWVFDVNAMATDITNNSSLVDVFVSGDAINVISTAAEYMDYFTTTTLSGGYTGGYTSAAGIRTGPYEVLLFINSSETSDGSQSTDPGQAPRAQQMVHWVGVDDNNGYFDFYDQLTDTKTCVSACA